MNEREYAGAKWWKFDFHTHTPASADFGQSGVTHESWLKAFMDKGIDCVAITDHNSGDWIDDLKRALEKIENNSPPWYQPLYLFPGVEITANGDVHILAIFGPEAHGSDITQLLGAVGYSGSKGKSDAVTSTTVTEVVNAIVEQGGLPIPAHADAAKGLFKLPGLTLDVAMDNPNLYAMELCDCNYQKPQLYTNKKLRWTEVRGSDTHSFNDNAFGTFTWIKMDTPSADGLKLALIDGAVSVNRKMQVDPNRHAEYFLEELKISKAKHIGRSEPLKCQFSPFLNTVIGGRGSGKSTLVEFMRLTLRRVNELPESLEKETRQYFDPKANNSLLIENSDISLIYRKGDVRYRLKWPAKADDTPMEEERNGDWQPSEAEVSSFFPVRIYSQKQILELANNPGALIQVIDEAPEVDSWTFNKRHSDLINQYKQIEAKQRELNDKISRDNLLRGESNDLARQIAQIEKSGHDAVLQNYSRRKRQLSEIDSLEGKWQEMSTWLAEMRAEIAPAPFNKLHFAHDPDILSDLELANDTWQAIQDQLDQLVQEAQLSIHNWTTEKNAAAWMQQLNADIGAYEALSSEMEQQDIDPRKFPRLLAKQKSIQKELNLIDEYRIRSEELGDEKRQVYEQMKTNRTALSRKRKEFLTHVLHNNLSVSIEVETFGEGWGGEDGIEEEIRRILQCEDGFEKDIDALKEIYVQNGGGNIEELKAAVKGIRDGEMDARDNRFARRLANLPQESVSDLILWLPKDDLKVTFGPRNQRIEQSSPGQKTAALLAFILSYGDEPLLLDQPEDDLDNELIYNLVVKQLRGTKSKRQVIVVTHNANIVVNGDAEMVLPLGVGGGETHVRRAASIQEKEVRESICDILEGGRQAFEERYKRIHLGD